ncbi:hypothetical protein [Streptomyces sp. NPDC013455]|uniref:hypothetical protein n=1 Tax=Streptomyces sp. NPDC013455 TaxID=3155605 RepID=UPI0033CDBF25
MRLRAVTGRLGAAATTAMAIGALALTGTPAQASTTAGTVHGCPSGAFCIYPQNAGWNNDRPSYVYWSGVYNLDNQIGNHTVFNNQTDGWVVDLCIGSDGNDCRWYMIEGAYSTLDLTSINSVVLRP